MNLIASPPYVVTATCLDQNKGLDALKNVIEKNKTKFDDNNENGGTKGYLSDETSGTVEIFIESKKLLQNNIKADEDDNVDENED
ncbi:unnamed protein product [Rotaria sordida]|uniref:Uncharacterized protein n=1 Tax=Rotaria sordida TaxID=392033 RepID=A0A818KM82_9BILA|nr:unnamed protein product [Rotaria sordida]